VAFLKWKWHAERLIGVAVVVSTMQMSHIETGDPVLGDIDGDAHGDFFT
jgi:hypothetical protein